MKKAKHQQIFDEYQRLKAIYQFDNMTEIIKRILGKNATESTINSYNKILRRHFGVTSNRYLIAEQLENAVLEMWGKIQPQTNGNVRESARIIANSLQVDFQRVINILYKNSLFGNCKKKKRTRTAQTTAAVRYQNEVEKWNNLFSQGELLKFSPAWVGKIQAA